MKHQEIVFNLAGQSFTYDPPEGRPSGTPTVQVFLATNDDDGTAETATTGSASVDSVNTTTSASADRGDTELTLTSGTSIARGRRYLIIGSDQDRETVEVISVSGTTIGLRRPLMNDYASGATFQGTRISIAVNSTWVADRSKITDALGANWRTDVADDPSLYAGHAGFRLRWAYTVDSVATIGISFADLVRYRAKNLVSPLDVDARFPGWIDRLPPDYQRDQGVSLVEEAFDAVRFDLLGDAQTVRKVRTTEVVGELTIYKANLIAAQHSVLAHRGDTAAVDVAAALYAQRYNQLAREPKFPVDTAGGGAGSAAERLPVWRR